MKKVLIIGGTGMLGHKLYQVLRQEFDVVVTLRQSFNAYKRFELFDPGDVFENIDLSNPEPIAGTLASLKPDVVINAAGVVKQIPTSQDVVETLTLNAILPHRLAALSAELGFRLILISTDCVFTGARGNYSESDVSDAADLYGRSKSLGEVAADNCLTLRTSIIGRELETHHGLLEWFLANRNGSVHGFSKAIFSGFPTVVFSRIIRDILADHPNLAGLYHLSSDPISKLDLLRLINNRFDTNVEIVESDAVRIDRSLNSDRFRAEVGFRPMPWPEMIDVMAEDSARYGKIQNERT